MPGAVFTWLYGGLPSTAVTNEVGAYTLALDTQPPEGIRLTLEKEGYEPSVLFVAPDGRTDVRRDVRLHRVNRIAVGGSVQLSLGPEDSFCAESATDWRYDPDARPCRRLHVVSSAEGRLDIWIRDAQAGPQYRIQLATNPGEGRRSFFSIPVEAGSETVLDIVLMDADGPVIAVLETRLSGFWDY